MDDVENQWFKTNVSRRAKKQATYTVLGDVLLSSIRMAVSIFTM